MLDLKSAENLTDFALYSCRGKCIFYVFVL